MDDPAILDLTRAAHKFWRRERVAEGWTYGPAFDAGARTHDALVPFDELAEADRRWAVRCIEWSGLAESLALEIDYLRGPDRPFTTREMRPGLPVRSLGADGELGQVVSWEPDKAGALALIRVRWENGEVTEHDPGARELWRVP